MKYIFFGSPEFAAIILDKLITAGFIPSTVVCNPDRPVGRKQIITPPPVKILAQKHGITVYQPERLNVLDCKIFNNNHYDFAVVAAYAKIIPKEILNIPRLGTIGVHPSLLPKYRGATPIQSIILNGEEKTGTTLFLMDEKIDHGPIIAQQELESLVFNFHFSDLQQKLAELSSDLLVKTLPQFLNCEIKAVEQNHAEATMTKKFTTEDGFIKPNDLKEAQENGGQIAIEIERKIRALNPDPGVWTFGLNYPFKMPENKRIKLLKSRLSSSGCLILTQIQIEGKKPISL